MKTGFMANNVNQFRRQNSRGNFRPNGGYSMHNGYASNGYWGGRPYGGSFAPRSGGFQRQGFAQRSQQEQTKPTNHNWSEEWTPANVVQQYKTVAMVMWVDGTKGEVVCERNLKSSLLHFYFDGRTVIGGTTVALAVQSEQGLGLVPGSKIEFEATYKPLDPREQTPSLVHITSITVLTKEPEVEVETISMLSLSEDPHTPKFAMNGSGDFVLISPVMLSKKWVIDCLNTTVVGAVPDYPVADNRGLLYPGRTVRGRVIKSPRWVGDVLGGRINPKIFLISIESVSEVKGGVATVSKLVPSQNVILQADDFPDDPMFYPIVVLPKDMKEQLKVGVRVAYNACAELPGFAYKWRVLETFVVDSASSRSSPAAPKSRSESPFLERQSNFPNPLVSLHSHTQPSAVPELPKIHSYLSELEQIFADLPPTAPEISKACLEIDDFLGQNEAAKVVESVEDMISFEEVDGEQTEEERSHASISLQDLSLPENRYLLTFPSRPPPSAVCHMLGASSNDMGGPTERCVYSHMADRYWVDEYNHVVITAAEQIAKDVEKKETRAKLKETKRLAEEVARELELEEMEEEAKAPAQKKAKKSSSYHAALSILEPPDSSVRIIGIYDSPFYIFTQLLQENEERRAEAAANERTAIEEAKEEPKKAEKKSGGWWFRRRNARVLPTVLVAELLTERTEDEVCVDYHVNSLTNTVVLRNTRKSPAVDEKKPSDPSPKPVVVPQLMKKTKKEPPVVLHTEKENEPPEASVAPAEEPELSPVVATSSPVKDLNLAHEVSLDTEEGKKKSGLVDSLMNDKIFGNFFQSLLKK